jgi:hypothetical protein
MPRLTHLLAAFNSSHFNETFVSEVGQLGDELPLQKALQSGSHALADDVQVSILAINEDNRSIRVRAGVFFTSIIAGCNCADDPTPVDRLSEYAEMDFVIDKQTADTTISIVA